MKATIQSIPIDAPPQEVTITMTEAEAEHLMEVIQHIGGPPLGPRGTFDRLGRALASIGVNRSHEYNDPNVVGSIKFNKKTS